MTRRDEIADAAITTAARAGMRGLTHRAVDRAAGLPEGSTSYYFRTRDALLKGMLERLVELDAAELPPANRDLDGFADHVAGVLVRRLTVQREREIARYELTLEATRHPELREVLRDTGARVRGMIAAQLGASGIAEPERRAGEFIAFVDGLLFDQIARAGTEELSTARLRRLIRSLLSALGA